MKLKHINETDKHYAHIDVIVDNAVAGYIMINHNEPAKTKWTFTSYLGEKVPSFYAPTKIKLVNILENIFKGEETKVLCGFGIVQTVKI